MSVNLNGAYYATQAMLPAMRERGSGHLIYVASVSALAADPSGAAYQAAKRGSARAGACRPFSRKRKTESAPTVICPGLVETEILVKRPVQPTAELLAKALQPIDVAEAILAAAKMPQRATVMELHLWPTLL